MKIDKLDIQTLWVPKEVDELWGLGVDVTVKNGEISRTEGIVEKNYGDYQHLLLDNLRSRIDVMHDAVYFVEKYGSYEKYEEQLKKHAKARGLTDSSVKDLIEWAKDDERLELGKQLLKNGVDSKKLNQAQKVLEKALKL